MLRAKQTRLRSFFFLPIAVFLSFFLGGCSGDSAGASAVSITGNAILGPVSNATVTAFALNADGTLDTASPLATSTTDSNGNYSLTIPGIQVPSGPVGIRLSEGSYTEESTSQTISLSGTTYTTILPTLTSGASLIAAVGPLPDMAYQKFVNDMQAGLPSETTVDQLITNANYQVSQTFGLTDIVGILPANPFGNIPNDATGQYALVMVAISLAAQAAGTDSTAIAAAYAQSFVANGNFAALDTLTTVTDASGAQITFTPPSLWYVSQAVSQLLSGEVVIPAVTPPANLTAPTLTTAAPAVAPVDYVVGGGTSTATTTTTVVTPSRKVAVVIVNGGYNSCAGSVPSSGEIAETNYLTTMGDQAITNVIQPLKDKDYEVYWIISCFWGSGSSSLQVKTSTNPQRADIVPWSSSSQGMFYTYLTTRVQTYMGGVMQEMRLILIGHSNGGYNVLKLAEGLADSTSIATLKADADTTFVAQVHTLDPISVACSPTSIALGFGSMPQECLQAPTTSEVDYAKITGTFNPLDNYYQTDYTTLHSGTITAANSNTLVSLTGTQNTSNNAHTRITSDSGTWSSIAAQAVP